METPIAREIRRRMQLLGITSMRKLSADAGLSESAVKEILSGKVKHAPRADTVAKLAKALGCSSSDLTGASDEIAERSVLAQTANIPEIEVSAGAGGGRIAERELTIAEWRFPTEWLRSELRAMPGDLRLITVEGDSMAPTIEPGDKVLVDFGRVAPSPPGLFVLWDGLALVAKRLEYIEGSEPPSIRILSDNVRYQPYERTCDEVRIVGRIRGRWQRL